MTGEPSKWNRSKKATGLKWGITICIILAGVLVVIGFIVGLVGYQALGQGGNHLTDLGNFGSYLQGTVASFWALAGVFLILVAFLVQKQQLQTQQEELELTRADLEEQKTRLESQQRSVERQNFETAFFQLLNLQNQIASQMQQERSSVLTEGRVCFALWYRSLRDNYEMKRASVRNKNRGGLELSEFEERDLLEDCYREWWKSHQEDLGHYFRTLYHLIKFVKTSDVVVDYKDKRRYTSLVRAQMSAYELAHLFYNGLSAYGNGFKPWIEEFGLLEHFDRDHLLLDRAHESRYSLKAFQ